MSKKTTNILGIVITILAGIYFYAMCCNQCDSMEQDKTLLETSEGMENKSATYFFKNEQIPWYDQDNT